MSRQRRSQAGAGGHVHGLVLPWHWGSSCHRAVPEAGTCCVSASSVPLRNYAGHNEWSGFPAWHIGLKFILPHFSSLD
jgi:hypothetical protein